MRTKDPNSSHSSHYKSLWWISGKDQGSKQQSQQSLQVIVVNEWWGPAVQTAVTTVTKGNCSAGEVWISEALSTSHSQNGPYTEKKKGEKNMVLLGGYKQLAQVFKSKQVTGFIPPRTTFISREMAVLSWGRLECMTVVYTAWQLVPLFKSCNTFMVR